MTQEIVFAAGCFWGIDKYFTNLAGVQKAIAGYTAGDYENPTYEDVLKFRDATNLINHTEAVQVFYNDEIIKTTDIIRLFWELHNPTQGDKQGNDIGNNYRSGIYFTNQKQEKVALNTKIVYQQFLTNAGFGTITTEIQKLDKFYPAEDYHQNYLVKNPDGYCPNHSIGIISSAKEFYYLLAKTKFGENSEFFNVAFKQGTDAKFCKKYDLFKETKAGYFVDKLSEEKLFTTADRFNSGTGWLSFYKAIDNATIEIVDSSLGMIRTEVVSKTSGVHLGHVFDDEIAGKRRFCINASVLDFVAK